MFICFYYMLLNFVLSCGVLLLGLFVCSVDVLWTLMVALGFCCYALLVLVLIFVLFRLLLHYWFGWW